MGRAERRRLMKHKSKQKRELAAVMTVKDIEKLREKEQEKAVDIAMLLLFSIPVKVMHEKYGWGMKTRLPEFAEALAEEYQNFCDGEATLEEYRDLVYEKCGMKFEFNE